jgi:hypothetical protein
MSKQRPKVWLGIIHGATGKQGRQVVLYLPAIRNPFADLMSSPTRVGKLTNSTQAEQMEGSYRLIDMVNMCGF